jgi:hypothetical protein
MRVDHAVVQVGDLDAARARYARLGFTVTPRGTHSPLLGSANHCVLFAREYIELYGILQPTDFNARFREALEMRGEHVSAIAFATDSAQATFDELKWHGVGAEPPVEFGRPLQTEDGRTAEAKFRVTLFDSRDAGLQLFACEHLTPEAVRRPTWLQHPNTAVGCDDCIVACSDPPVLRAAWQRIVGDVEEGMRIRFLHWSQAGLAQPANAAATVAQFRIRVTDPGACADRLSAHGVAYHLRDGAMIVDARDACGVRLRFEGA